MTRFNCPHSLYLVFLLAICVSFPSYADVSVDNTETSIVENFTPFTSAIIPTGIGQVNDYQIIACAVNGISGNPFSAPSPGTWNELDNGSCGGGGECAHGIWGRFTNNANSEDITCSWTQGSNNFTAGSFRYSNVEQTNPIINISCNEGFSFTATSPSIMTEAGSQVIRIYSYTLTTIIPPPLTDTTTNAASGFFLAEASFDGMLSLSILGETELFPSAGATGTADLFLPDLAPWRACTLALRMATPPPSQFNLNVTKSGSGNGAVTSMPAGIDCGSDCSEDYDVDTMVELTATPDSTSTFVQWSGDCSGTNPVTSITITSDSTCDAEFVVQQRNLTLNKLGNGTGTVTSSPAGISCDASCNSDSSDYDIGTVVTLTATPSTDSTFAGWGADCLLGTTSSTTNIVMDNNSTCTATFSLRLPTPSPTTIPPPTAPTGTPSSRGTPTPSPTIVPPPDITSIPALNQWGHLSIAVFAVLIGVWVLRRHKIKT